MIPMHKWFPCIASRVGWVHSEKPFIWLISSSCLIDPTDSPPLPFHPPLNRGLYFTVLQSLLPWLVEMTQPAWPSPSAMWQLWQRTPRPRVWVAFITGVMIGTRTVPLGGPPLPAIRMGRLEPSDSPKPSLLPLHECRCIPEVRMRSIHHSPVRPPSV